MIDLLTSGWLQNHTSLAMTPEHCAMCWKIWVLIEREREREIHYVHSASLAYEDGIVFMSEPSAARQ